MSPPRSWLPFLRIPAALLGVFLFFSLYNRFLLNANLQNLRASLSVLDAATGVGQAEAALLLVDQALVTQMAEAEADLPALVSLEHARGSLSSDQPLRSVEDAQAMVAVLARDQEAARPAFLKALDGMATGIRDALGQTSLLPRQIAGEPTFMEIDESRLQEAIRLERRGGFPESARLYEQLLADYPRYAQRAAMKLRLAQIYQRMNNLERAEALIREAQAGSSSLTEVQVARQMLARMAQGALDQGAIRSLQVQVATLNEGQDRQKAAFELGCLLIKSYRMEEALQVFQAAAASDPKGEWALPALFREAWCLRYLGRMEEALQRFRALIEQSSKSRWAAASYQQIGEICKASGDYSAAIEAYKKASEESPDAALSAIFTTQAGATALLDLKDAGKAAPFLRKVVEEYPASPLSPHIERILAAGPKPPPAAAGPTAAPAAPPAELDVPSIDGSAPLLAAGTPVMTWLESFLPIFVEVFMERMSKYMQAVGETEMTRKYTESEFQDLVVRRVQARFPGQTSNITTRIHPDGFVGAGDIHLGPLHFPISARIGITVVEERPNAEVREVTVGPLAIPKPLLRLLGKRVNETIQKSRYPLKIKRYELKEGWALISVEMAQ